MPPRTHPELLLAILPENRAHAGRLPFVLAGTAFRPLNHQLCFRQRFIAASRAFTDLNAGDDTGIPVAPSSSSVLRSRRAKSWAFRVCVCRISFSNPLTRLAL